MTGPAALFLDFQAAVAGRYALEHELGRGGMGVVYLARDLGLERPVAIKLLPPAWAVDGALRERFLREARTAAKLSHPHIVPIHAVEAVGGFVFFVMSYIEGETLGARVRRDGPIKAGDAGRILREVAWALAYAHAQGVVHRDVKADNILLEQASGRALVADFGIARLVPFQRGGTGLVQAPGVAGAGELVGTPEYMSAEQVAGDAVDGRSDLYSLGVVGYLALTGRLPFEASSVPALLVQQVSTPPPPLVAPGAPRSLVATVERCLAKDRAARFQTGEELADALGAALRARPELPLPVRVFLTESRRGMLANRAEPWIVAAVLVPAGLRMVLDAAFAGSVPTLFRQGVLLITLGLGATALVSPLAFQLRRIRRFLRDGFGREDVTRGLWDEVERLREEREFAGETGPTRWERLMRLKAYGSLALAAVTGAAASFVPYPAILVVFGVFGLSCATAFVTGLAAFAASRRRLGVEEEGRLKLWVGPIGRWMFRLGGLGLRRTPTALPPADRPTEVALGHAALAFLAALPDELRRSLGDVPAVVRGLEDHARRLRRAAEDSGPARDIAQRRLREALTALETIRLDLLRLHGGVGTLDGLTQDLEAARGVGEEVDRLLDGVRTVEDGRGR